MHFELFCTSSTSLFCFFKNVCVIYHVNFCVVDCLSIYVMLFWIFVETVQCFFLYLIPFPSHFHTDYSSFVLISLCCLAIYVIVCTFHLYLFAFNCTPLRRKETGAWLEAMQVEFDYQNFNSVQCIRCKWVFHSNHLNLMTFLCESRICSKRSTYDFSEQN